MRNGRHCPLCGTYKPETLTTLVFAQGRNAILPATYHVVRCRTCDFVYDDVAVEADVFARYYAESGKYVQRGIGGSGDISAVDRKRYEGIIQFLKPALRCTSIAIADVGCGKGGLLRMFKEHGYSSLHGFEPSPACVDIIEHEHGISATCAGIGDLYGRPERFELITISNVFEHLYSVHDAIDAIDSILQDNGYVYVDVPDGSRYNEWFYAPYYSFDMEHINHFNVSAMECLWAKHGYKCIKAEELTGTPVPGRHIPMCRLLFQKKGGGMSKRRWHVKGLAEGVHKFIEQSRQVESKLEKKSFPDVKYYWGCGAYAKWMLNRFADSTLGNPLAIVDVGARRSFDDSVKGIPIIRPSDMGGIVDQDHTMIITSVLYEKQIFARLKELGWSGPVYSGASGRRKCLI